jgi:hypothetical protein
MRFYFYIEPLKENARTIIRPSSIAVAGTMNTSKTPVLSQTTFAKSHSSVKGIITISFSC